MKEKQNKELELADLQKMLLSICNNLNRPIRKNQLIKMVTELFECNTSKQIEFSLLNLIEQGQLYEQNHFIVTVEFSHTWNGAITATDEGIIKYLLTLKEEAKHDLYFNVFAEESLTSNAFFKYVQMKYPTLISRKNTALTLMEQMENTFSHGLSDAFYTEMNDYPTNRWLTNFFDNPDCRLIIKTMDLHKNHINLNLLLLSGKKRSYRLAHEQYDEFEKNIKAYFDSHLHIHTRTTLLTMKTGNMKRKNFK